MRGLVSARGDTTGRGAIKGAPKGASTGAATGAAVGVSTTGMSTNFVVAIELPTMDDPDKWTLAGMAALLNLTD